ncbi:unnamed protein product [Peniophora sp. CBMAI 1063]|nr:unnamed protein product [Peniophora sp. CBMAI 1063]
MRSDDEADTPPRKRQRMSSPTYDEQLPFPSQTELNALDGFTYSQQLAAAALKGSSQPDHAPSEHEYGPPPSAGFTNAAALHRGDYGSRSDGDNPFIETGAGFTSARSFAVTSSLPSSGSCDSLYSPTKPAVGFSAASRLPLARSPSPDAPPEQDFSTWFAPSESHAVGFATASAAAAASSGKGSTALFTTGKGRSLVPSKAALQAAEERMKAWDEETPVASRSSSAIPEFAPMIGFTTAKGKAVAPSSAALKSAETRMKQWDNDTEEDPESIPGLSSTTSIPSSTSDPFRPVLAPVHNSPGRSKASDLAKHSGFSSPMPKLTAPSFASATARPGVQTDLRGKAVQRPFSSPLLARAAPAQKGTAFASPLNPGATRAGPTGFSTPIKAFRPPLAAPSATTTAIETPLRRAAATLDTPGRVGTPSRALGATPLRRGAGAGPKKFTTPFKPGMAPGQPGRAVLVEKLRQDQIASASQARSSSAPGSPSPIASSSRVAKQSASRMFDLSKPKDRTTLADSEFFPGTYDADELADMGLPVDDLKQITPAVAVYYLFNPSTSPDETPPLTQAMLGPASAYATLQSLGGTLASRPWVDNAWSMILWKLAGLACLDPQREQTPDKRWSYAHVLEQLRYRYARELAGGQRPALRLIATQDINASAPMVLCVSDVIWPPGSSREDVDVRPELELTDGWYRLRAEVDPPLARAARAGKIVRGGKLAFASARFAGSRPEPTEILEGAYESVKLSLNGNSSCLAPWHAKLGLLRSAPAATLHSLTPDGGGVHLLDVIVSKVFPIAFIEFIDEPGKGPDGKNRTRREGPRKEADEARAQAKWEDRRTKVAEKLRVEAEKRWRAWESWAGALVRKAKGRVPAEDDEMPANVEELLEELIDSGDINAVSRAITPADAGWLATALRSRIDHEREHAAEELEREVAKECPQRNVRSFRVLFMKDAKTDRRPARRTAEITVWDVLNLAFEEGRPGHFAEGQRFLVSNLQPNQAGAWMSTRDEDSHVYLRTVKGTRWTKL